ncbi:SAM domain-containing protein SAMSN-1-like [Arapaima gigas]
MNLFCFSLEGSMDSLYEPVQTPTGSQECNLTSRPCSPSPLLLDSTRWGGSQPCIATESSRMLKINSRKKKKKKENTTFPKLPLDCRAVVGLDSRDAYREIPADQADVSIQNRWNEVLAEGGAGLRRLRLDRMDPGPQEDRGALGVIQKLVRPTKGNHSSLEDTQGSAETADSPVVSCMGLAKKTETSVKEAQGRTPQGMWEGRAGGRLYATWDPRSHVTHQRWSTLSECSAPWDHTRHTCLGTLDLHHSRLRDFGLLRDGDHSTSQWEPFTGVRSVTDLDDIGDAVSRLRQTAQLCVTSASLRAPRPRGEPALICDRDPGRGVEDVLPWGQNAELRFVLSITADRMLLPQEYISSLLLNGYETVEDLKELKEQHLIELNVSDPEHRSRLLGAVDGLPHAEGSEEEEGEGGQKEETPASRLAAGSDCPRDSGCYVTPELSENSRDDVDGHNTVAERPPGASQGPDVSPEQTH